MGGKLFALFPALALASCATVPTPGPIATKPPQLVVAIAVDQFSADLFDEYRSSFTGGLARLAKEGVVFRNGYQPHAATETCPGHATIMTGVHPARSGVIANNWYDPTNNVWPGSIYCAEDEDQRTPSGYVESPRHLKAQTLGEQMKIAWPHSISVAVAGKDRAAVMMGGHTPDWRYYYRDGSFQTDLGTPLAPEALTATAEVKAAIAAKTAAMPVPADCVARARAVKTVPGGPTVGVGRFDHGPSEGLMRASPMLDAITLKLADGMIDRAELGRDDTPDLLAISLSATDYVGHAFGTEGQEMCIQVHALDHALGEFFADLDPRGVDYAVVLTADHGGTDIPERLMTNDPSARRAAYPTAAVNAQIVKALGLSKPALVGSSDVYIEPSLDPSTRAKVEELALAAFRTDPNVEAVFSRADLQATPMPVDDPSRWTMKQRVRASFDPRVSGDFVVLLKHHVVPVPKPKEGSVTTHGSAWDQDRRVPILFWRRGMAGASVERPIMTVDIAPTLAAMLGISMAPGDYDGHCLPEISRATC